MKKKKVIAAMTAAMLSTSVMGSAMADFTVTSAELVRTNGSVTQVKLTSTEEQTADIYLASYSNDELQTLKLIDDRSLSEGTNSVVLDGSFGESDDIRVLVWNDNYEPLFSTLTAVNSSEKDGYTAYFNTDEHASVTVSATQSFDEASTLTENASESYAYNKNNSGEIDVSGSGQVNFKVVLEEGYVIDTITAEPSENYNNFKSDPESTGDKLTYRLTKVTGDVEVNITTKEDTGEQVESATGSGTITLSGSEVTFDGDTGVEINGTTATINKPGEYTVTGSLDNDADSQIVVDYTPVADETDATKYIYATINLDNASITNSQGAAIYGAAGAMTLASKSGTTNTLRSKTTDTTLETTAVYSKDDIEIKGDGTLNVVSDNGNGIRSKENVEIGKGTLNVTAGNNGIKGDEEVKFTAKCGTVTINSVGDGVKSDNAPTIKKSARTGEVIVNGGIINITTGSVTEEDGTISNGDGIQADTLLTIKDGTINIDAKGEALKSNFSHLDLAAEDGYADLEETLAAGDGCIVINGGTITATAGEDGIKAAKDITVSGGDVTVKSAGDDGLQAGDVVINETTPASSQRIDGTVTISDGAVNIEKAAGDGIAATLNYVQTGGTVTAAAAKDGVQAGKAYTYYDIHGTGDDETVLYETNGVVNITGGSLTITAAGGATRTITDKDGNTTLSDIDYSCKGIKARKLIDISGGTLNINALDDALHSNHTMRISGGDITVRSCDDGVHGEYYLYISDEAKIDVQKSYEGIEGSKIYISGGETYVVSTDDGANAAGDEPTDSAISLDSVYSLSSVSNEDVALMAGPGGWNQPGGGMNDNSASYGYMEVSGGLLYIESEGDGFDTNGSGLISGGTVLVNGPTSGGNGVFDKGDNSSDTLIITGGTVIGAGTSDMAVTPTAATGSQAYVVTTVSTQSASKAIQVLNGSNEIISYVPSKSYAWIFVSTPSISNGTSYTVKYGGTLTGGTWGANYNETYGIKTGATLSGGSSATVTAATSGGSSSGGNPGGSGGW